MTTTQEVRRLNLQAELYDPFTRRLFIDAGMRAGMRVLDIGSGTGTVGLIAAQIVGPSGSVVGIEHNPAMAGVASAAARARNAAHVTFVCGDANRPQVEGPFDAIVGRFVLRELGDAGAALRRLSNLLAPEGVVAFQEKVHSVPLASYPPVPVLEQLWAWVDATRRCSGVELDTGLRLAEIYGEAGLAAPTLRVDTPCGVGSGWPGCAYVVAQLQGMLPMVRHHGIAGGAEIDIVAFGDELARAADTSASFIALTPCVGAIAARPRALLPS